MTTEPTNAEREQFEAWARKNVRFLLGRRNGDGEYVDGYTREAWAGWQARAATVAPPRKQPKAKSVLHYTFDELLAAHDSLVDQIVERDATIARLQASHTAAWNQSVRDGERIAVLEDATVARPPREPTRDRPTTEPGGMECEQCGAIFIGAEWHALCAVCNAAKAVRQQPVAWIYDDDLHELAEDGECTVYAVRQKFLPTHEKQAMPLYAAPVDTVPVQPVAQERSE